MVPWPADAFAVMRDGMTGKVGIGKLALYGREYLVAVRPLQRGIVMHTLHHAAEIRSMDAVEELNTVSPKVKPEEIKLARQVIDTFEGPLDLASYKDEYREGLQAIIDAKIAGAGDRGAEPRRAAESGEPHGRAQEEPRHGQRDEEAAREGRDAEGAGQAETRVGPASCALRLARDATLNPQARNKPDLVFLATDPWRDLPSRLQENELAVRGLALWRNWPLTAHWPRV